VSLWAGRKGIVLAVKIQVMQTASFDHEIDEDSWHSNALPSASHSSRSQSH
jgi:hypothetical protein